jgi:hypothetical protein
MKKGLFIGILLLVILALIGFFIVNKVLGNDREKRLIVKEISSKDYKIQWYVYSLISSFSPDYVEFQRNDKNTLLCKSSYVSNIDVKNDTIVIQLWKNDFTKFNKLDGIVVVLDTTGSPQDGSQLRHLDRKN